MSKPKQASKLQREVRQERCEVEHTKIPNKALTNIQVNKAEGPKPVPKKTKKRARKESDEKRAAKKQKSQQDTTGAKPTPPMPATPAVEEKSLVQSEAVAAAKKKVKKPHLPPPTPFVCPHESHTKKQVAYTRGQSLITHWVKKHPEDTYLDHRNNPRPQFPEDFHPPPFLLGYKAPDTLTEADNMLVEAGLNKKYVGWVSSCLRRALLVGAIKITDGKNTFIAQGSCDQCGATIKVTLADVLYQPDNGWDYCEREEATLKCKKCGCGAYVESMCEGEPEIGSGKFFMHCTKCPNHGTCHHDYRMNHCDKCGDHFHSAQQDPNDCYNCHPEMLEDF